MGYWFSGSYMFCDYIFKSNGYVMIKDKDIEKLKKIAAESAKGLNQSQIMISIFTESYKKDPVTLIQLGMSILMDKPMAFVVPYGVQVPENIIAVAKAIEYYDANDKSTMEIATDRLMNKMKDYLK